MTQPTQKTKHINATKVTPVQELEVDFIDPLKLHEILPAAATVTLTFSSEKRLQSYRRMIYSVNKQAEFRYRTVRTENTMWGLTLLRMK